jgi:riboflavin kinase / FMN adenylyltransferase
MNQVITWDRNLAPLGDAVVAIGVFDGVHIGHQALMRDTASDARERGLAAVAVTFDRDPDQVVTPDAPAPQLLTLTDKCAFLLEAGADQMLVIPFDADLAALSPERFLEDVLLTVISPRAVHVGTDFRFGRYAEGTVDTLATAGVTHGFTVSAHELITAGGTPITSTRIRSLVSSGDVRGAARLLGRDHRVSGLVVRGRGIGRQELGVPTANMLPSEHAALPLEGVYSGWALVEGTRHPAAISVGTPPTFPGAHDRLEAHILGLASDLYGHTLTLGFTSRLRDQVRFGSKSDLSDAMRHDIDEVRRSAEDPDTRPDR